MRALAPEGRFCECLKIVGATVLLRYPLHELNRLFDILSLKRALAGLNWQSILTRLDAASSLFLMIFKLSAEACGHSHV